MKFYPIRSRGCGEMASEVALLSNLQNLWKRIFLKTVGELGPNSW